MKESRSPDDRERRHIDKHQGLHWHHYSIALHNNSHLLALKSEHGDDCLSVPRVVDQHELMISTCPLSVLQESSS